MSTIYADNVVLYTAQAIQQTQHWLADQEGEVIDIKGKNTRYAVVEWQDETKTSVLLCNLEKWPPAYPPPTDSGYETELLIQKVAILRTLHDDLIVNGGIGSEYQPPRARAGEGMTDATTIV